MQSCPFCGSPETDRVDLDGRRILVFRCMFSPSIDPNLSEVQLAEHLRGTYAGAAGPYFRGICDRLHLFVVQGEGARELLRPRRESSESSG